MTNTLRQQIAADAAEGAVFLNSDEFAESIEHWPLGDERCAVALVAIVEWDDEAASTGSGADGEGNQLRGPRGERQLRYCQVELPASVAIDDRDKLAIGADVVSVVRVVARDNDLQTVRCVRVHPQRSRTSRVRD